MGFKYGIFNPDTGLYTFKETYEEACAELATVGFNFYKAHCLGNPCAYVEVKDDGSEVWKNSEGAPIPSPEEIKKQMEKEIAEATRVYAELPKVVL